MAKGYLRLKTANGGLSSSTVIAASSNYTCMGWFRPRFSLTDPPPQYGTFFTMINAGYTDFAGAFFYEGFLAGTNDMRLETLGTGTLPEHAAVEDRAYHYTYRRSGTSHILYVDGRFFDDFTRDISGLTWTQLLIGQDGFSTLLGDFEMREWREWNAALNIGEIIDEMWSTTAVRTSNLYRDCPLISDANDISGNGRHLTLAGSVNTDYVFVEDVDPPANITASAAIALTPTAGAPPQTIVQDVSDNWRSWRVYYKYTNNTGRDQVFGIGTWGDLPGGAYDPYDGNMRPFYDMYLEESLTNLIGQGFRNGSNTFPVPAGKTFWFEIRTGGAFNEAAGLNPNGVLNLKVSLGPTAPAKTGDLFINSASFSGFFDPELIPVIGLHGGFLDPTLGTILTGYIPQFPCGEGGDVFPAAAAPNHGRLCYEDGDGSIDGLPAPIGGETAYYFYGFLPEHLNTYPLTWAWRVAIPSPTLPPTPPRAHLPSGLIYLLGRAAGTALRLATVDASGNRSAITNLPAAGHVIGGIAVNVAATKLYLGKTGSSSAIAVWDLVGGAYLSDFAATVASHSIVDMLCLADDTLLVLYWKSTNPKAHFVRKYHPDGTLLATYTPTVAAGIGSTAPRLGYASDATPHFWILLHTTTALNDVRKVRVSDLVEVVGPKTTPNVLNSSVEQASPPIPYISDSCPIVELFNVPLVGGGGGAGDGDCAITNLSCWGGPPPTLQCIDNPARSASCWSSSPDTARLSVGPIQP